jgi:hypothetical protein
MTLRRDRAWRKRRQPGCLPHRKRLFSAASRRHRADSCGIDDVRTDLANRGVLIARASAATDRADQLAAFDQRESARACDQRRIERRDIAVAGFKRIVEQAGLAPEPRCRAGLADRNRS